MGYSPLDEKRHASLGPEINSPITASMGLSLRIRDDLRKSVVFIGRAEYDDPENHFEPDGTGLLLGYDGCPYLVTAAHIAKELEDGRFYLRVNTKDGEVDFIQVENARWHTLERNKSVDIALTPFIVPAEGKHDCQFLNAEEFLWLPKKEHEHWGIGVGDLVYAVGLFKLWYGKKRNLPIVHCGNIAMVPEDDTLEVEDWNSDDPDATKLVESYLIECHALDGLSGSPVYVRPSGRMPGKYILTKTGEEIDARVVGDNLLLLGIFQASWDAKAAKRLAEQQGQEVLVPVNVGIVVPAEKLKEVLDMDELKAARNVERKKFTSVPSLKSTSKKDAQNPNHKEDFNRLLGAAVQKKEPDDQT